MKRIVDVSEEDYMYCLREEEEELATELESAIANSVALNGLTNGEMIKKMFPHYDIEIDEHKGYVRVFYEDFYTTYPLAWWNRKWGE